MKLSCVLLAAGSAKRFGENKLLFPINGAPMAFHSLRLHSCLPYDRRTLVTQAFQTEIIAEAEKRGFLVRINERPEAGISESLRLGLSALLNGGDVPDGVLFGVCDQPYLTEGSVRALMEEFEREPRGIVSLAANGRRGNPVIFAKTYFEELRALSGDSGGSQVIKRYPRDVRLVLCGETELTDIDQKNGRTSLC